jgi:hypothetical protein
MNICKHENATKIEALNLDPIKIKLMDTNSGKGWSRDQCDVVEKWYKRFLTLNLLYPEESIVPTKEIDEFWHYHILDTRKYADDCQSAFGNFFHHFPYFGMRDEEDSKNHKEAVNNTKNLFLCEFGEPPSELSRAFSAGIEGLSAYADCNGEPICSGDPNPIRREDFSRRPAFPFENRSRVGLNA